MSLTNQEVLSRWVNDLWDHGELLPRRGYNTRNIHGRPDHITYDRFGEVVLGRYLSKHRLFVLNGNGFQPTGFGLRATGANGTWQTNLRTAVRQVVPQANWIIIPYQALNGANVVLLSMRLIDSSPDGDVQEWEGVPDPPLPYEQLPDYDFEFRNADYPGRVDTEEGVHFYRRRRYGHSQEVHWAFRAIGNANTWNFPQGVIRHDPEQGGWGRWQTVHRLGESLFSAIGEDGKRHKFLSGFDLNETNPLYFLAQLPDGSGATTIDEARRALAPPIVHQAWKEGRDVRRQGDVFFIPTELATDEIYRLASRRVRRECVLVDFNRIPVSQWPTPEKGEVRSKIPCPCKCGHVRWTSDTERGRRTLAIYGTAHTADEVVVTKTGTTYVKGAAHHDPRVVGETRRPDHRDVPLVADMWYLAVRNTVPRRRVPRPVEQREEVTT